MWETFDWRRESRGAEAGGKRQRGAPCHQSLFICPEERAFQPGEGSGGLHVAPEPTLILGLIPERGNTFQSFTAHWPKKDKVTWGWRSREVLPWVVIETQISFW